VLLGRKCSSLRRTKYLWQSEKGGAKLSWLSSIEQTKIQVGHMLARFCSSRPHR
jgi:hypothetical protein